MPVDGGSSNTIPEENKPAEGYNPVDDKDNYEGEAKPASSIAEEIPQE